MTMMQSGEQFSDDLRCARVELFPAEILRDLTELNTRKSACAVAQTVLIIISVVTVTLVAAPLFAQAPLWMLPWLLIPAIVVIATQQHALFVLAHEAAHYRLFPNRRVNDLVGRLLAAAAGLSMCAYRVVHRLHHNYLYDDRDPDIALHGGYPRGKAYLARKILADLLGLTAWKTYSYFFGTPAANSNTGLTQRPLDDTLPALRKAARDDCRLVAVVQIGMPVGILMAFGWKALGLYFLLWIVPAVTLLQAILRIRAICEHGAPAGYDSALKAARTTLAGPVARLILFPHHVNYHIEHHLYPAVPHYNLHLLHTLLKQRGILAGAEVRGFASTWRRVFAPTAAQ